MLRGRCGGGEKRAAEYSKKSYEEMVRTHDDVINKLLAMEKKFIGLVDLQKNEKSKQHSKPDSAAKNILDCANERYGAQAIQKQESNNSRDKRILEAKYRKKNALIASIIKHSEEINAIIDNAGKEVETSTNERIDILLNTLELMGKK
jgi:hypothetical protein